MGRHAVSPKKQNLQPKPNKLNLVEQLRLRPCESLRKSLNSHKHATLSARTLSRPLLPAQRSLITSNLIKLFSSCRHNLNTRRRFRVGLLATLPTPVNTKYSSREQKSRAHQPRRPANQWEPLVWDSWLCRLCLTDSIAFLPANPANFALVCEY